MKYVELELFPAEFNDFNKMYIKSKAVGFHHKNVAASGEN